MPHSDQTMGNSLLKPVHLAGLMALLAYAYLAWVSDGYGTADLVDLLVSSAVAATACFGLWYYCHRTGEPISAGHILVWAMLFRLVGVLGYPILEDDIYRYLWDGRMLVEAGSPYGVAPSEFFGANLTPRFDAILDGINYPDVPTIYGPVNQWLFGLSYLIAPGQIWPLQVVFALADIALIVVLMRLAPAKYVLLYAWSPLLVKEFAFTAHPDVLGALFLMVAVWAYRHNRWVLTAASLAVAVGVKIFALIMVPIMLRWQLKGWAVFVLTAVLIAWPLGVLDAWLPGGLEAMAGGWLFNAPVYQLLADLVPLTAIKAGLLLVFILVWTGYFFKGNQREGSIPRGDWLFGLLFLCMPVLNAWYLVWLLPFAVIYPSRWSWTASVSLLLAYGIGLNLGAENLAPYQQPWQWVAIEFGVICFAGMLDIHRRQALTANHMKFD